MTIHPSAIVDPSARLGEGVSVGPGAVISAGAVIGPRTTIGPNAVICTHTTLGEDCRVHAGAVIGDTPQDLGFKNTPSFVRIGDRVTMREGVTIHRGTKENTETVVGDECYLMANSHLAHNVTLGRRVILANGALLGGYVSIGDFAFISGNALIHQFCRIGRLAMVGGGAGISKDVPPFCTARSITPNAVMGLNVVGMRRVGIDAAQRKIIRLCFDIIFRRGFNTAQALAELEAIPDPGPYPAEFIAFIRTAKRGICKLYASGSGDDGDEAE